MSSRLLVPRFLALRCQVVGIGHLGTRGTCNGRVCKQLRHIRLRLQGLPQECNLPELHCIRQYTGVDVVPYVVKENAAYFEDRILQHKRKVKWPRLWYLRAKAANSLIRRPTLRRVS